jgi:hypothetical protein
VSAISDRLTHTQYEIRRQAFKLAGGAFRIYDPSGQLVLFANQKAFRIREDIRLYTDESMQTEALAITTRQIIDWSASYDVVDSASQQKIGALRRRGLASMAQDYWVVLDAEEHEIGHVQEDSLLLALVRRFVTSLLPQRFHMVVDGATVATFSQNFNPFVLKLAVDFSMDDTRTLDRRLGLAAGVLLCAIEGRQG